MVRYVPVQLIQYALAKKVASEFRTFLFLKNYSKTAVILLAVETRVDIQLGLCISRRTLERHIKNLTALNWIGTDNHNRYFIRSWEALKLICEIDFLSRVEFTTNYISKENHIGYFMGAVIAYQCKLKRAKEWRERRLERSKQPISQLHPLSISYLSNLIKLPESTVRGYKQKAILLKFVYRKKNKIKYGRKPRDVNLKQFRSIWADQPSYPILIQNTIYLILPDSFNSTLHFKKYKGGKNRYSNT